MPNELAVQTIDYSSRAKEVVRELEFIRDSSKSYFFQLCDLFLEAYENQYHLVYGYPKFGDWIDACNLDIKGRSAYYYLTIAQKSRELGISREDMLKLPVSSLKEIFSLDPELFAADIKQLVATGEDMTVDEVKQEVKKKKLKAGEELTTHINIRLLTSQKDVVDEAFELARRMTGSVVNEHGEIVDISDARCLELICATFLCDPNNHGDVADAEFEEAIPIQDEVRIA